MLLLHAVPPPHTEQERGLLLGTISSSPLLSPQLAWTVV